MLIKTEKNEGKAIKTGTLYRPAMGKEVPNQSGFKVQGHVSTDLLHNVSHRVIEICNCNTIVVTTFIHFGTFKLYYTDIDETLRGFTS